MMPVPPACTMRPMRSTVKPGGDEADQVLSTKELIAVRKTCRVVKRFRRNPVVGMMTAMVSMNALVSHWPSSASMPRVSLSFGIAIAWWSR